MPRVLRRLLIGLLFVALGAWQLVVAERDVVVVDVVAGPSTLSIFTPGDVAIGSAPGVVVAHGFAGSRQLMRAWSTSLARAGFVVVTPDLAGHGTHVAGLDGGGDVLFADVVRALDVLQQQPGVDVTRLGLLGHSMGSGAVLRAGIELDGVVRAVVAVSPTDADVDASRPNDLLLLVGELEPRFVANAESLLERAGGAGGTLGDGDARALEIVPRVEHVTILFSDVAHERSAAWLGAALGHELRTVGSGGSGLLRGWLLVVIGLLLSWQGLVLGVATPAVAPTRRRGGSLLLPVGGLAATASLVILARSVDVSSVAGTLVAGEVAVWFALTGAVWLRFGVRPAAPDVRDVGWAALATLLLIGVGASASLVWLPWWSGGARTGLIVIASLAVLPFTLAASAALHGRRGTAALGTWVLVSSSVMVNLGVAAFVTPGLGFLILLLPLLPLVVGLLLAVALGLDRPWASGLAGAVVLGWLLAVIFPVG